MLTVAARNKANRQGPQELGSLGAQELVLMGRHIKNEHYFVLAHVNAIDWTENGILSSFYNASHYNNNNKKGLKN